MFIFAVFFFQALDEVLFDRRMDFLQKTLVQVVDAD